MRTATLTINHRGRIETYFDIPVHLAKVMAASAHECGDLFTMIETED